MFLPRCFSLCLGAFVCGFRVVVFLCLLPVRFYIYRSTLVYL
nr:MAG TPA: hypothetical protein [Caudoviricetes sp.]